MPSIQVPVNVVLQHFDLLVNPLGLIVNCYGLDLEHFDLLVNRFGL